MKSHDQSITSTVKGAARFRFSNTKSLSGLDSFEVELGRRLQSFGSNMADLERHASSCTRWSTTIKFYGAVASVHLQAPSSATSAVALARIQEDELNMHPALSLPHLPIGRSVQLLPISLAVISCEIFSVRMDCAFNV